MQYDTPHRGILSPLRCVALVVALLLMQLSTALHAQQRYTLTNSSPMWHIYDKSSRQDIGKVSISTYNTKCFTPPNSAGGQDTVIDIASGTHYLALSIDPTTKEGAIVSKQTNGQFDPYCVWLRTGSTGYYFQEWGNYRYYLHGNGSSLGIQRVEVGGALTSATYWYDWDFGAALQEISYREGERQEDYYWVMFDGTDWGISCSSYERPETVLYACDGQHTHAPNKIALSDTSLYRHYWCETTDEGQRKPMGVGAITMPVERIDYPTVVGEMGSTSAGLNALAASKEVLDFGDTALLNISFTSGNAYIRPAYTVYQEEKKRDSIASYWRNRVGDGAGKPFTVNHFYEADGITPRDAAPEATLEELVLKSKTYVIDLAAQRYVGVKKSNSLSVPDTLIYHSYAISPQTAKVVVVLTYTNGASQSDTIEIQLTKNYSHIERTMPENAPLVRGSVYGGGRKAGVGGNTKVVVHNCDTISAVYGGNDISGRVMGVATVVVGTDTASVSGVHIGSVYGGGNGYYTYADLAVVTDKDTIFSGDVRQNGALVETGFEKAYLPDVKGTLVKMSSDKAMVDSVFGGSRNAFVAATKGCTPAVGDTVVRVRFEDGSAYAVFGGNNVGGALHKNALVSVAVSGSTETSDTNTIDTYFTGFGRDFGIRYLFGGGNRVATPSVCMEVTGGMVDTAFGGGNMATINRATKITINCADAKQIYHNNTRNNPDTWVGGMGRYNLRAIFGGNNRATMTILPEMELKSGGIGTVYAGGNAGDMDCDDDIPVAIANAIKADFDNKDAGFDYPSKLGTYLRVNATDESSLNIDYLFGGCQLANVKHSTYLKIEKGDIGYVNGGSDASGDIGSLEFGKNGGYDGAYLVMSGGKVRSHVFGGSAGDYNCTDADGLYIEGLQFGHISGDAFDPYGEFVGKPAPTLNAVYMYVSGGEVMGSMYGGGIMSNVGFETGKFYQIKDGSLQQKEVEFVKEGESHLTLVGGTVHGSVYGGGSRAAIYGLSYLTVKGSPTIDGSLFAGNDKQGTVGSFAAYVDRPNGVSAANYKTSDGTSLNVADAADRYSSAYSAYVRLEGTPTIGKVYGGGNGAYNYGGADPRPEYGEELVQCYTTGDNRPVQTSSYIDIYVEGGKIDTVFGGGNGVGVSENVVVLLNNQNADGQYVNTIFGGNNRDNMGIVPDITLLKGQVANVYGGCNAGNMTGYKTIRDQCGNSVSNVATYILVNSDELTVDSAIYGGCRQASVIDTLGTNPLTTFIDIRKTSSKGVNYVYGGSDVSGSIDRTRIDVSGGTVKHIYGGSNGYYDYVQRSADNYDVYDYGYTEQATHLLAEGTPGEPAVDSTTVKIMGGNIESSVYGGGRMGECRATYVMVDDLAPCGKGDATISGTVYGGGQGDYLHLNLPHRGNVTDLSVVDLVHAQSVSAARAYGGGQGGDVYNTHITTHETWDQPFDALYGGCWGSDVLGTATVEMNGRTDIEGYNVDSLFGGNDKTGNVYRSCVVVNSGTYGNIYGAGNGNYADTYSPTFLLPNNEYVELDFNGGEVDGSIYGGGLLGTTFRTQKNADGTDVKNANNLRIPDTTASYSDPDRYAHIFVNLHDGVVHGNVYAGGAGRETPLVYGLKMLNMDGGVVDNAVYGGSENVSDGYMAECNVYTRDAGGNIVDSSTTLRPSSIVNIVGGEVRNNVYGGGYLGNIYGSVYVNIGIDAVRYSTVWANKYNSTSDSTYKRYMPGYPSGMVAALTPNISKPLKLDNSVYGGANWGMNTGNATFNKRGFYGGENRILVDGQGYNTRNEGVSSEPMMDIHNSIIGAGTSALGGDVLCRIDVQNYGGVGSDCRATKELYAIQRADQLWLHNTAIRYLGSTDASSVYTSQMFTINRIDSVVVRGYNVIELDALLTNVYKLGYFEDALDASGNLVPTQHQQLYVSVDTLCNESVSLCDQLAQVSPTDRKYTALLVNNGVNVDINYPDKYPTTYGVVDGFAYLLAENGTNAVVMARAKYGEQHTTDGGFMSTCNSENKKISSAATYSLTWGAGSSSEVEYPYYNYSSTYRVWKAGQGKRSRYAVILAHSNPDVLDEDKTIKVPRGSSTSELCLAYGQLVLPPAEPGHFYKLSVSDGINVSNENNALTLIDSAWYPNSWASVRGDDWQTIEDEGQWAAQTLREGAAGTLLGLNDLFTDPENSYGLVIGSGANFSSSDAPSGHVVGDGSTGYTPVSGNSYVTFLQNYATTLVDGDVNASPIMDLYLTYNNEFSTTTLSTVRFTLEEWVQPDGGGEPYNLDADINVEVTISTIVDSFRNMEYDLLAMYNEGRSNLFTRKAVLPATLQHRELYLDSVAWFPTYAEGRIKDLSEDWFELTGDDGNVINSEAINRFCIALQPVDNVTTTNTSSIGWSKKSLTVPTDLYSAFVADASSLSKYSGSDADTLFPIGSDVVAGRGLKLGELDGRGLAGINLGLTYNGNNIYPDNQYLGRVVLSMSSYVVGSDVPHRFHIALNVRSRKSGDTIYLASANALPRPDGSSYSPATLDVEDAGKTPDKYLQSLYDAFTKVYREGDVICILDTLKINSSWEIGRENASVPVPIIRYDGHHHQMPGERYVYRGPMLWIDGATLTAKSITFDGSSLGKVRVDDGSRADDLKLYEKETVKQYQYADTNKAYAPIAVVTNGGKLYLNSGTTVCNNWNATSLSSSSYQKGAISLTDGGELHLTGNVVIEHNISEAYGGATSGHPLNGAVYVNGGRLIIEKTPDLSTAIVATDNYLMSSASPVEFWQNKANNYDKLVRFDFVESAALSDHPANVLLTRSEATPGNVMTDQLSDRIAILGGLTPTTRIGVSKWFPGPDVRDTINIVVQTSPLDLQSAYDNQNFQSDEGFNIFYNPNVNNQLIYLHRCASFHFQDVSNTSVLLADGSSQTEALRYVPDLNLDCPTGGDTIFASLKGGFFPYEYRWTGSTSRLRNTLVANNVIETSDNFDAYRASVVDTLITTDLHMGITINEAHFLDTLTVTDLAGCQQRKFIDITVQKVSNATFNTAFKQTGSVANWTSADTGVVATGLRQFHGITITPKAWVSRNEGTISAKVEGDDNDYVYHQAETEERHELENLLFCEGDRITLATRPSEGSTFLMWDFDPFYETPAHYVVPALDDTVIAYFGPTRHWIDTIRSMPIAHAAYDSSFNYATRPLVEGHEAGFVTTYHGDVHIYDERGLAWFISVVNGLNGTQAKSFYFNRVFLHQRAGGYDMKDFLWTPVGTQQHPFRGWFLGVKSDYLDTTLYDLDSTVLRPAEQVTIKNIIINEPETDYAGLFGFLDDATICNIKLEGALVRGSQYVGALAASSVKSRIVNCAVEGEVEGSGKLTTILSTHYASGGVVALSQDDTINVTHSRAKYIGDAVYSGGIVGHATSTRISNSSARNDNRMEGLYVGGLAGYLDGTAPVSRLFRTKSSGRPSVVENNYVHLTTNGRSSRVGGIAGYATNTVMQNNYVYGDVQGRVLDAAVQAASGARVQSADNYYASSSLSHSDASATAFEGEGNQVLTEQPVRGIDNLTRLLNRWVNEAGEGYVSWRSDLEGSNGGYPIFGTPDLIPVHRTLSLGGCGEVEWEGQYFYADSMLVFHTIDSTQMIDSVLTLAISVEHGARTALADTATAGTDYQAFGFYVSAAESLLLRATIDSLGSATLLLSDTIAVADACDSIVTLSLTFTAPTATDSPTSVVGHLAVYPNPTTAGVTIERTGLTYAELFDNEGRLLQRREAVEPDRLGFDLSNLPAGSYFIRAHAAEAAPIIKKIIKQ